MRRSIMVSSLMLLAAAPAHGQSVGLRDRLSALFTFGTCGQPLCLDLNNTHGDHFLPSATQGNATVLGFVTEAMAKSASNIPISATSSGATYSIVDTIGFDNLMTPRSTLAFSLIWECWCASISESRNDAVDIGCRRDHRTLAGG